jgi:hypothetical protein
MRAWEKRLKATRDTVRRRLELGTNGGAPTAVRRAVGLTSAPVMVDDPEIRNRRIRNTCCVMRSSNRRPPMRGWEKGLKAARDAARRRPDVTPSFTPILFCNARRKSASRLARTRSVALLKMRLPTRHDADFIA